MENRSTPLRVDNKLRNKSTISLQKHQSPGTSVLIDYNRRHISTSGWAQNAAKRAQLKSMENSSLRQDNKLRKSYYFSTETLVSGHKCSN